MLFPTSYISPSFYILFQFLRPSPYKFKHALPYFLHFPLKTDEDLSVLYEYWLRSDEYWLRSDEVEEKKYTVGDVISGYDPHEDVKKYVQMVSEDANRAGYVALVRQINQIAGHVHISS